MGELEQLPQEMANEIRILFTITALDQTLAKDVSRFLTHAVSHWTIPECKGFISGIAFPFSQPENERCPSYRFTLNNVLIPKTPLAAFCFEEEKAGSDI